MRLSHPFVPPHTPASYDPAAYYAYAAQYQPYAADQAAAAAPSAAPAAPDATPVRRVLSLSPFSPFAELRMFALWLLYI